MSLYMIRSFITYLFGVYPTQHSIAGYVGREYYDNNGRLIRDREVGGDIVSSLLHFNYSQEEEGGVYG